MPFAWPQAIVAPGASTPRLPHATLHCLHFLSRNDRNPVVTPLRKMRLQLRHEFSITLTKFVRYRRIGPATCATSARRQQQDTSGNPTDYTRETAAPSEFASEPRLASSSYTPLPARHSFRIGPANGNS